MKRISHTNSRTLLAGVSLLALGVMGWGQPAQACVYGPVYSATSTTISDGFGGTCAYWVSGDLVVTDTGSVTSATSYAAVWGPSVAGYNFTNDGTITATGSGGAVLIGSVASVGTLTNSGAILGTMYGISVDSGGTIDSLINTGTVASTSTDDSSGTDYAIVNAGAITLVDNSGQITGAQDSAIYNSGHIGTLTNSGSISAPDTAVKNISGGTIDVLTNSSTGIISATDTAISNAGQIGALTNNGIITSSGTSGAAINNVGTIGTLTNTGILGSIYNWNDGTTAGVINAINNSGTISGYIYNLEGTLGTITNSGVIKGDISNITAGALTINGGDDAVFGTLTGSGGGLGSSDKATLTSDSSNVVFGLGNLLLNDDILVSGYSVINSGATLQLVNAVTITGDYSQSGGGLWVVASSGVSSYGYLVVTGAATISSSTVTISGSGLASGQTYTIVDADSGDYTTSSITATVTTSGLTATVSTANDGDDLIITLSGSSSGSGYQQTGSAVGSSGSSMGATLDTIAASSSTEATAFQSSVLAVIDALDSAQQATAIKQLAPTQNVPSSQMSTATATAVLGAVEQHQQTAMAYDPATGAAAGSETHDSAIWGQFLGGGARRGSNAEADGYRLTDFGLAAGIDHMFSPNAMGGVALSWVRAWSEGTDGSSGSSSILDSYQLTFYGTYRQDRAFVDGQLGLGWNEFDQKRAIAFLGTTASAQYSGQQYLAKATVGYDLPVADGVTLTPLASLRWLRAVTGSYDETGAGSANLSIDKSGVTSVSQDLGAKVAWSVPTSLGNLKPEARLAWIHDYTNGPIATSGVIGGTAFAVTTPRTEADGVRVGLAASINGDDALSLRAEYEGELRAHYQSHTGIVKAIYGF